MTATELSMRPNDIRERERLIAEALRSGRSRQDIADELGYADDSAITKVYERLIKRATASSVEEIRGQELDRLDALMMGVYAKARRGDEKAVMSALKIMDRRAKYLGLDFSDGIAERQVALNETIGAMLVSLVEKALNSPDLGLSPDKRKAIMTGVAHEMREIGQAS